MWPSRSQTEAVTCPACGTTVDRDDAREYDKYGDRWDREGKSFEYFCRRCHDQLCHHDRGELEALLAEAGAGERSTAEFIASYVAAVEDRYGRLEER